MIAINLPRRRFLKFGALVGGSVLAATQLGCATGAQSSRGAAAGRTLLVLTDDEAELVEAIGRATLPGGGVWPTLQEAQVVQRLDEELFFVNPRIQSDFKLALKVVDTLPLLYGYFSFFSSLPREKRQACLKESEGTRFESIRAAVNGCRMAIHVMYFGHESSWKAMGYDGPFAMVPQQPGTQRAYYRQLTAKPQKPISNPQNQGSNPHQPTEDQA